MARLALITAVAVLCSAEAIIGRAVAMPLNHAPPVLADDSERAESIGYRRGAPNYYNYGSPIYVAPPTYVPFGAYVAPGVYIAPAVIAAPGVYLAPDGYGYGYPGPVFYGADCGCYRRGWARGRAW